MYLPLLPRSFIEAGTDRRTLQGCDQARARGFQWKRPCSSDPVSSATPPGTFSDPHIASVTSAGDCPRAFQHRSRSHRAMMYRQSASQSFALPALENAAVEVIQVQRFGHLHSSENSMSEFPPQRCRQTDERSRKDSILAQDRGQS